MDIKRESIIGSYYTLSACMDKIPDMGIKDWEALNEEQRQYLDIYKTCRNAKIPEIESRVSVGQVEPINKFLADRGFRIQLDPIGPMDLAIASVLEVLLKWMEKGEKTGVYNSGNFYEAVDLKYGVRVLGVDGFREPVAEVKTKNGDTVYMAMLSARPTSSFEVFSLARELLSARSYSDNGYNMQAIFPMIDLDTNPDISWLIGMADKHKNKWQISQALQQTIIKMDEKGVLIKEAVALGVRCLSAAMPITRTLVINRPFLFVVKREGLDEPFFSAYLDTDSWIPKEEEERVKRSTGSWTYGM